MILRETLLQVDLGAIRRNAQRLRAMAGVPVMAVVKADGYGHGAAQVARAALEGGASALAVAWSCGSRGSRPPSWCWAFARSAPSARPWKAA